MGEDKVELNSKKMILKKERLAAEEERIKKEHRGFLKLLITKERLLKIEQRMLYMYTLESRADEENDRRPLMYWCYWLGK